jgi:hypothetical protein
MRDAARAAEMAKGDEALEKLKGLAEKGPARKAATGQAGKTKRVSEEAARKAATGQAGKAKRVSEDTVRRAATGQAGKDKLAWKEAPAQRTRAAQSRRANRAAQFAPRNSCRATAPTRRANSSTFTLL